MMQKVTSKVISIATTLSLLTWFGFWNTWCVADEPTPEEFFDRQLVDHLSHRRHRHHRRRRNVEKDIGKDDTTTVVGPYDGQTWTQRYYSSGKEFKGPGSPIFIILGGEGHISPETGLFYPFVTDHLAKIFGAYVIQPEHRFYGKSQPVNPTTIRRLINDTTNGDDDNRHHDGIGKMDPRVTLFTTEQALYDALYLVDDIKIKLGCSPDKFSEQYCPVITVGGSYPGYMSAMARIIFPHKVDMAYAASAPIFFYSQQVHQYDYYNLITKVADETIPGCADEVRKSLLFVKDSILSGQYNETILGICKGTIPSYINTTMTRKGTVLHDDDDDDDDGLSMLVDELMMVVGYTFANDNMANYPPGNNTRLYKACETFTSSELDHFAKVRTFLTQRLSTTKRKNRHQVFEPIDDCNTSVKTKKNKNKNDNDDGCCCWNMTAQLPTGHDATITSGDWSGVGTGPDGESWDFQTCTLLVEAIGFSKDTSMFPPRDWSLSWLQKHCWNRFRVVPRPYELIDRWKFNNLVQQNVTRILFTNGLKDGWSVGGFKRNISESLLVLNFPNGAHHSDLSHTGPSEEDSDDIKEGFQSIISILGKWLDDVRSLSIS